MWIKYNGLVLKFEILTSVKMWKCG